MGPIQRTLCSEMPRIISTVRLRTVAFRPAQTMKVTRLKRYGGIYGAGTIFKSQNCRVFAIVRSDPCYDRSARGTKDNDDDDFYD
jgi:hypothetical protein